MIKHFTQSQLEAIAGAIGDTNDGLTGSEIGHLLASCKMKDPDPALTKRHRLYNALALSQNERQDRLAVLAFIRKTMQPERFARDSERFEPLRASCGGSAISGSLVSSTDWWLTPVDRTLAADRAF